MNKVTSPEEENIYKTHIQDEDEFGPELSEEKYCRGDAVLLIASEGTVDFWSTLFPQLPADVDIFRKAIPNLANLKNKKVRQFTINLLHTLQKILIINIDRLCFSGSLPPLQFLLDKDDSLLLEWIFKDFRIGFIIEPNVSESSWYFVSNSKMNEQSASGLLNVSDYEQSLHYLISFVLANV